MKIICIARNYSEHAAEMGAPQFERGSREAVSPAFFLKPETALLSDGQSFTYPEFSQCVEHEIEVVVRICKEGKGVAVDQAQDYYDSVTLGIDFTARDLQREAKAKGLPWTLSKGFDGSAAVGNFVLLSDLSHGIRDLSFSLLRNGAVVQKGNTGQMLCDVDGMIAYLSQFMTLQAGDIIFTGTPSGVGPVDVGDTLEGVLEGHRLLQCKVIK